ncbi:MAG: hypothetical protein IJ637_01770 [Prevotella sp.]|nr:hypothetical protein [Prevotella sp.]
MKRLSIILLALMGMVFSASAAEKTILLGPKTIGKGWKDRIVIVPEQFRGAAVGDIMTLYTTNARGSAQAAFQNPQDWQPIAPEYAYFSVKGPVRVVLTADMLAKLKANGLSIGGHDYQIVRVTLIPAAEMVETVVYKGPSVQMNDDWSRNADIQRSVLQGVRLGDDVRFYVSKVKPGAAFKLADTQWNAMDASVDGAPLGGEFFTWSINDQMQMVKLQLAGADGVVMHVGGKGYQLDRIAIVRCTAQPDEDVSTAQRAPREYKLLPGELFRGERVFPADYSENLRLTAAPFQEIDTSYALVVSYRLLPDAKEAKLSFREQRGDWHDISGTKEPQWRDLNGRTVVLRMTDDILDKVKTKGIVISGCGFTLNKVVLVKAPQQ